MRETASAFVCVCVCVCVCDEASLSPPARGNALFFESLHKHTLISSRTLTHRTQRFSPLSCAFPRSPSPSLFFSFSLSLCLFISLSLSLPHPPPPSSLSLPSLFVLFSSIFLFSFSLSLCLPLLPLPLLSLPLLCLFQVCSSLEICHLLSISLILRLFSVRSSRFRSVLKALPWPVGYFYKAFIPIPSYAY